MSSMPIIKLYGSEACHKTNYYKELLDKKELVYQLLDVVQNDTYAEELRNLYETRKLNFPTLTIGKKKLRNPKNEDLLKWLNRTG